MAARHAWMAFFLMVLLACGEKGSVGEGVTITDSAGVEIVFSAQPAWDSESAWALSNQPRLSIGVVTGDEAYLFFRVADAFLLPDGRVVIVHASRPPSFRIYDEDGKHVRSIGGEGEGPGEFRILLRGWLDSDETLIGYDPGLGRITRFTLDGQLVDSRPVQQVPVTGTLGVRDWPPLWVDRFDDGTLLGQPNGPSPYENGRTRPLFAFTRLDLSTQRYDTIALGRWVEFLMRDLEKGMNAEWASVAFSPRSLAVAHDTTAFVSDNKDFWIEEIAPGGRVIRRFGRAFDPEPVTPEDIAKYKAEFLARALSEDDRRERERRMRDEFFADTFPAHDTRMLVDSGGRLWVALRSPDDSDIVNWSVFNPRGVFLGNVSTPKQLRVTDIRTDAVVGVWLDDLDVQSVRVYDLRKPSG